MANCSFVAVSTRTHSSTINVPAGVQDGDLLIAVTCKKGTSVLNTLTGWTARKTQTSNDSFGFCRVWTRIASSEPSTYTLTGTGATPDATYVVAYRPIADWAFVEAPDAISGAQSRTAPSLTPSVIDDLVIYLLGATSNVGPGTITSPFTMATRLSEFHNSFYYVYFADLLDYNSTSATGTIAPSTSGTSTLSIDALFQIVQSNLNVGFISSNTTLYALAITGDIAVPFISSATQVFAPALQGNVEVPFISSNTSVYTPTLQDPNLPVPFIASGTQVYAPTLTAASSDVNVPFIASTTAVHAPGLWGTVIAPSGIVTLTADAPVVYPIQLFFADQVGVIVVRSAGATISQILPLVSGVITLRADTPQIGPLIADSGVLALKGDAPRLAGIVQPPSGILRLKSDPPIPLGAVKPPSGVLKLAATAPTIFPIKAPSGVLAMKASAPANIYPLHPVGGRVVLAGTGPPYTTPMKLPSSGVILLKAGAATMAHVNIILQQSGIIRLRSDTPVVIPLTEPPPPPPPTEGTGSKISGTVG